MSQVSSAPAEADRAATIKIKAPGGKLSIASSMIPWIAMHVYSFSIASWQGLLVLALDGNDIVVRAWFCPEEIRV
jgi:hypothetical protein